MNNGYCNLNHFILLLTCSLLAFSALGSNHSEVINHALEHDGSAAQRESFEATVTRINTWRVRNKEAKKLEQEIAQLDNFSLYPYLEYELIKHNIAKRPASQLLEFFKRYKNLPFIPTLRRLAISKKYKSRQWQDVVSLHKEGNSLKYQCMYVRALYNTSNKTQALAKMEPIWLHGSSLPKTCDPMLKAWSKANKKTTPLIKQRIELAFKERNSQLAKYLAKSLNKADKAQFDYWYKVYKKPQKIVNTSYWQRRGQVANAMLFIGMERLLYQKPKLASTLLSRLKEHPGFTASEKSKLINKLILRLITKDHVNDELNQWLAHLNWKALNNSQKSQVLRHLVGQSQWTLIAKLYPTYLQIAEPSLEWQYWHAIALLELKQTEQAHLLLKEIATQRRYYGFLASDILKVPYSLNHQILPVDAVQLDTLLNNEHLIRAYHLYRLDRNVAAQREWYYLVRGLNEQQRVSAAQIAHRLGWHDRAIITLTMTAQRDDLSLRFPMPHKQSFIKEAKRHEMDLSWPISIARQESAFMARANSAVGARGLMQLMPTTARLQAKQSHVLYQRKAQLYKPALNIKLGTGYLSDMLDKFDNNLAVAAAAYNAGPHRVKHWVKKQLPQAQWVETIPYRETREYVKNVLAYSVIYQQRLARNASLPSVSIYPERMNINAR